MLLLRGVQDHLVPRQTHLGIWIATGLGLRQSLGQPAPQEAQFVQQFISFFGEILGLGYPCAVLRTDPFAELGLRIHLAVFVFTTVLI